MNVDIHTRIGVVMCKKANPTQDTCFSIMEGQGGLFHTIYSPLRRVPGSKVAQTVTY